MKRLLSKLLVAGFAVTAGVVLSAGIASAGGWAMTSLDAAPNPVAGVALDVGFTIRQHGVTPVNPDGEVGINVRSASGSEKFFPATAVGPRGHFVARVRIATPGSSTWQMRQGWFAPQDLGRIDVARPAAAGAVTGDGGGSASTYRGSLLLRVLLPALGVGLGAFAVVDALAARRRRSRDLIAT